MRRERSEIDKKNRIQQKIGRQLMNGGYWYIHVNCDALLKGEIKKNKFEIGNTKLEAIIFPYIEHIPIKLAEKLLEWSKKGLKLLFLGKLPHRTSGYLNFEKNDQKLQKIIKNLNSNEDSFFKISGKLKNLPYLTQYMTENMGVEPFLTGFVHDPYTTYIWRIYEQQDVLFLRNSKNDFRNIKINFGNKLKNSIKQKKYKYELDPWSGGIYETKFGIESEIKNYETLQFAPFGTRTFVFSSKKLQISNSTNRLRPYKHLQTLSGAWQYLPIKDSWNLTIRHRKPDANLQDISLDLPKLKDWRDLREAKYCSGPGLYQNKFTLTNAQWESLKQADKRVLLDLGKVQDVAEISINKKVVGNYLIPPYRADITKYVKEGDNRLEITITGTLQNRLVGYGKQFKKAWGKYRKRRLVPVGLIGPVKIFIADFPRQKTK